MKKGFTLAELLGVIVIIGIIVVITVPIVTTVIKNSREATYKKQVDIIEKVAKEWGVENVDELPDENTTKKISISTLVNSGKIQDSTIIDPRTDEPMNGCVVVSYNNEYNQYEYKYSEDESFCTYQGTDISYICEKVGEASKTVGAQYKCNIATPEEDTTFYVLGENDNDSTKIDLIMDRNFTDEVVPKTLSWCIDGGTDNTTCQNINSKEEGTPLKHIQDTFGSNVEVSFPTKDKIISANNGSTSSLPQWLYDYLYGTTHSVSDVYGYLTASPSSTSTYHTWSVYYEGRMNWGDGVSVSDFLGVRPVITISKYLLD